MWFLCLLRYVENAFTLKLVSKKKNTLIHRCMPADDNYISSDRLEHLLPFTSYSDIIYR